ncbi:hypothetical protein [Vampirovibrio sp.]|uniref:hypothetical protein n=1 Tax=Vampirovibrio sp. TaxID=2717857 RepID=UPI0035938F8C
MKKNRLLTLFCLSLLMMLGYAMASPEDELGDSLETLQALTENAAEIWMNEDQTAPPTVLLSEGEATGQSATEFAEDETDERFSLLNLRFLDAGLPMPEPDNHTGDLSSDSHGIPEPMVFDLVRPLGAKKGALEINTLFQGGWQHKGRFSNHWAPEVEYAFRDGMALEFELPMGNLQTEALKFAFQATLPSRLERVVHGVQFFNEYGLRDRTLGMTAVHIGGLRLSDRWSVLSINGLENANLMRKPSLAGLINNSLFYRKSDKMTLGIETNLRLKRRENGFLLMPQIHLELTPHYSLQMGAGFRKESGLALVPTVGMRLIRTF